jgi:AcrR family transcriptional regulator
VVDQELSLRERKKQQTRDRLWRAAVDLFSERGFDQVSVAEIAAAAEVSKMTVFNYFPSKEDLILGPMEAHVADPARIVRERQPGESAVAALRRHFLAGLAARDPSVGLNDDPAVLRVQRLIRTTPALLIRAYDSLFRSEELLSQELGGPPEGSVSGLTARVAAAQIIAIRNVLIGEIVRRLLAGESAEEVYPGAVRDAQQGFDLLEGGLGDYHTRAWT